MSKRKLGKAKPKTTLWYIGFWATIWWGVSGIYLVLLLWLSRNNYIYSSMNNSFLSAWKGAIKETYTTSSLLPGLLSLIIIVWAVGAIIWIIELKRQKIKYKTAFKDLFLTIRK